MARIRTIKPEFWKSEAIARHSFFDRLVFIGLWTYVDDNGVGLDNPKLITAELFALEEDYAQVSRDLRETLARLAEAGRIRRYAVAGKAYLSIVNWSEHQKIDRPGKPRYPQHDHPEAIAATAVTSTNTDAAKTPAPAFDAPSRDLRETLATPHLSEQGAWSMEQGAGTCTATPPARRAPTPKPALFDAPPSQPAVTAGAIVAAYMDGAAAAGQPKPAGHLPAKVGRDARKLLAEGIAPESLIAAAHEMGKAGWENLALQLQRTAANRNGSTQRPGHSAYREKTLPDGSRDMSGQMKPL